MRRRNRDAAPAPVVNTDDTKARLAEMLRTMYNRGVADGFQLGLGHQGSSIDFDSAAVSIMESKNG